MVRNVLLVLVLLVSGCSQSNIPFELEIETGSVELSRSALPLADFGSRPQARNKSYLLVAGGRDDANFAQEVVEQKRHLLGLGVPREAISCFFTRPFDSGFLKDEKQYRQLAPELADCYPAMPKYIWEEIEQSVDPDKPFYLYVTSHGSSPLSQGIKRWKMDSAERKMLATWLSEVPALDQFSIALDALPNGDPTDFAARVDLLRAAAFQPRDLVFSPRFLKNAILSLGAARAPRFIVAQACYSGGFITSDDVVFAADGLKDMDQMTLMTAARYDRVSFGCGAGFHRTYFGGAFTDALSASKRLPEDLDWADTYRKVSERVRVLETEFVQKLSWTQRKDFKPSEPMFSANP